MNWRLIWRGLAYGKMRNKILAILGLLLVYRLLAHIPLPLAEPTQLKLLIDNLLNSEGLPQYLSLINVLSGGALASLSIMLIGLGPYINASIIMQVLTKALPRLETLQKEGEFGRRKINQYTRLLTLPLAVIQSVLAIFLVRQIATQVGGIGDILAGVGVSQWILLITALTAGAVILMWLGELITEHNLGNGISLLITVAIISQLPILVSGLYNSIFQPEADFSVFGWFTLPIQGKALLYGALLLGFMLLMTVFVVYINEAHRKIRISYAKKVQGNRTYSDVSTHLPLKLVAAGVVPIIFAVAFLTMPQLLGQIMQSSGSETWVNIGTNLAAWFSPPGLGQTGTAVFSEAISFIYPVTYFLLVVGFTYFYTNVIFSAKDIAERLQYQGGFIAGIRPGQATEKYISQVVNRLNLFGAISLGFLALTPILAQVFLGVQQLAIGGTSILILVAVALETLRQVESMALVVTYKEEPGADSEPKPAKKPKRRPSIRLKPKKRSRSASGPAASKPESSPDKRPGRPPTRPPDSKPPGRSRPARN